VQHEVQRRARLDLERGEGLGVERVRRQRPAERHAPPRVVARERDGAPHPAAAHTAL
jgi:hypothetical protein